jgi:hypothetical protein
MPLTIDEVASGICDSMLQSGRYMQPKSWRDRLLEHHKADTDGCGPTPRTFEQLATDIEPFVNKIDHGQHLSARDLERLRRFGEDVYKWGRMMRGYTKSDVTGRRVASVIETGLRWRLPIAPVPMSSGWSKVVSVATTCVEKHDRLPHAIFDSRVAASLLTRLDYVLTQHGLSAKVRPKIHLPSPIMEIGFIRMEVGTRGGQRGRKHAYQWPGRYRSWKGQFAASMLVGAIRDRLNDHPNVYGLMPLLNGGTGRWTVRGVEVVLFRDGY